MFLKNKNIIFKIRRPKVADYAALTTSNTTLNNSHETENVTKAVDHKPIDSKTCTEFRELLSYDRGHSSNTFNIDACSDKK